MFAFGDQEIEALLGPGRLKAPAINCVQGHRIERFCCNPDCPLDATCCNDDDCNNCQGRHSVCAFIELKKLMKRAEGRLFFTRKTISDIIRAENDLINQLSASRKVLIEKFKLEKPDKSGHSTIDSFFLDADPKGLKGKHVKEYISSLSDKTKENEAEECLQKFKKEGGLLVAGIIALREHIVQHLLNKPNINFESKILLEDKEGSEKGDYILKQLGQPSKLKLLYRGSQHDFSAAKFHQLCDNIPKTLTIVRTEFNKTIAAQTPLKWQSSTDPEFFADPSFNSFLLQLELKEKMTLINGYESHAIKNDAHWGPGFGHGRDLAIADKCHQNCKSFANFPTSYNCNGKYIESQASFFAFSGARDGQYFRVVEYEVFEVTK